MKVTHVLHLSEIGGHYPLSGAENHLWSLLPALASKGIDVELIAIVWHGGSFPIAKQKLNELSKKEIKVKVIALELKNGAIRRRASIILTWQKLFFCLCKRRHHIIHLHLEMKYTPFIAWVAGCRRIACSIHNDLPIWEKTAWRIRLRILNHIVSYYIAISECVRCYYMEVSGARPERVTTVYYGIETPKTEPFAREQFKIPKDAFVVGFVGRLVKQKNLNVFLEALRQQGNVLGVIVGSGPQLDELKRYVEIRQIANVRFLGPIPDAERVMPTFNLLCLPSLWEGLGLVLIEAMLRRVSIIGSRRGAIPEILGRGRYGILFDPTVDGLIQAIAFALENPSLLSAQVEEAYEYARKQFTVEAMVHNTINVYRLIEESGKGI